MVCETIKESRNQDLSWSKHMHRTGSFWTQVREAAMLNQASWWFDMSNLMKADFKTWDSPTTSLVGGRLIWSRETPDTAVMDGIFDRYNTGLVTFVPKVTDRAVQSLGDCLISSRYKDIDRLVPVILSREGRRRVIASVKQSISECGVPDGVVGLVMRFFT